MLGFLRPVERYELSSMGTSTGSLPFNADAEVSRLLALCDQGGLEHEIRLSPAESYYEPRYHDLTLAISLFGKHLQENTLVLEEDLSNLLGDTSWSGVTAVSDPPCEAALVHIGAETGQFRSDASYHQAKRPTHGSQHQQSTGEPDPGPPDTPASRIDSPAVAQGSAVVVAALAEFQLQQAAYVAKQAAAEQRRALLAAQVLSMP